MYHFLRNLHKWIGLFACLFLVVTSVTGFLLAIKKRSDWVQPFVVSGGAISGSGEVVSMEKVYEAAREAGGEGFSSFNDLNRVDYRPGDNVFKVRSADGLREVQVDGATGKVLKVSPRRDQLFENIHDLSFFGGPLHDWVLPVIAVALFLMGTTGVVMFFVPVVRRWRFRRSRF